MKTGIYFIVLACLFTACPPQQVVTSLNAEDEFERAMSLLERKKYDAAVQSFERILFFHPSSEYVDDAQYWLGRSYYEKKDYDQAIVEFDYLIKNFSTSTFVEEAYLYRAEAHYKKAPHYAKDPTELEHAVGLFDQFLTQFPNSQHTDEVKKLILAARDRLAKKEIENGKLYLKLGEDDAALLYFTYVIATYPETNVNAEAKYYAATLHEKKGNLEQALELYKELLEEQAWRGIAERKIKELEKPVHQEP